MSDSLAGIRDHLNKQVFAFEKESSGMDVRHGASVEARKVQAGAYRQT